MERIEKIISNLEEKLLSSETDVIECLKNARIVAMYYNDTNILDWINNELLGYSVNENFPNYRRIPATLYQSVIEVNQLAGYRRRFRKYIGSTDTSYSFNIAEVIKQSENDSIDYELPVNGKTAKFSVRGSDLKNIIMQVNLKLADYIQGKLENISKSPYETTVMHIFNKFHLIAKQLEKRYENRETIIIKDEYDVQDLLRAILYLHFDSVHEEEYNPQYAGKRSRIDFLLRFEHVGIEAKKIRDHKHAKKVKEEIIYDKEYYSKNEKISDLYFFIYDPDFLITERYDLINDLEEHKLNFKNLRIIIKPEID